MSYLSSGRGVGFKQSDSSGKGPKTKLWFYDGTDGVPSMKKAKQADSSSAFPAPQRPVKKKESKKVAFKKQLQSLTFSTGKIHEAEKRPGETTGKRFKSVMLEEGLGNLKSLFYYTKQALESAVPIFEGKKIYADHPSKFEEDVRPERSTRDVLGHWENVHVEDDNGRSSLVGDIVFVDSTDTDWARSRLSHALDYAQKYPGSDFVGVSINASGDANPTNIDEMIEATTQPDILQKLEKAKNEGAIEVNVVTQLQDAMSCDLVTDAGAGGKVIQLLEGEKNMAKQKKEKEMEKKKEDGMPDGHDDAAQDIALMKDMMKKYGLLDGGDGDGTPTEEGDDHEAPMAKKPMPGQPTGDGGDDNPPHKTPGESEVVHQAYQTYQAYQALGGMEKEEAMKCAVHHQRLKQAMEKKHAESETEKHEAGDQPPTSAKPEAEKKESDVKLLGRIAMLEAKIAKSELETYIEKQMKESKLSHQATKLLREGIAGAKTKTEVDEKIKLFKSAYLEGGQTKEAGFTFAEKANHISGSKGGALDFSELTDAEQE